MWVFIDLERGVRDLVSVCLIWFVNIQTLSLYTYIVDEGVATRAPVGETVVKSPENTIFRTFAIEFMLHVDN